jgi:hypothetical protein
VPPVAFLVIVGLEWSTRRAALPVTGALALWAVSIAAPVTAAYAAEASPATRAFADVARAAQSSAPGAFAMHQTFRRPFQAEQIDIAPLLASPPRREWLELARYWRTGAIEPLWFLADPTRTDVALFDPASRADFDDYSTSWSSLSDMGGMRPKAARWYRVQAPGWFVDEGWALTPEAAGIARLMGRGPSLAPITGWVRRRPDAVHLLVGGRHLGPAGAAPLTFVVTLDGTDVVQWNVKPGFFLEDVLLPAGVIAGDRRELAPLTIRAISPEGGSSESAVEQFDAQSAGTLMWGFAEGWHEAEYHPTLGVWRWSSERSTMRVLNASAPVALTLSFEPPQRYFDDPVTVRVRVGDVVLTEGTLDDERRLHTVVPLEVLQKAGGLVTLETNQTFVPADTSGGRDRRRLGLRVFGVNVSLEH